MIPLLVATALAQNVVYVAPDLPGVNAQLYRQPLDALGTMWTNDASLRPTGYFTARASFGYTRDPFLYQWTDGYQQALLRDAVQINVAGTIHFWRMRFGIDVPVYLLATSDTRENGVAGLGSVLLDLKGTILDHDKGHFGLALAARTELPTNTTPLSLGKGVGYEVEAILDGKFGGFLVAANIGHRGVPKADLGGGASWDDSLILRGGVAYMFEDKGGLSFDVGSSSVYSGFFQKYTTPVEAMVGGWARLNKNVVLRMGLGTGLTDAVGSPAIRTLASVAWEPTLRKEPAPEPVVIVVPPEPVVPGPGRLVIRTIDVDGQPVAATATVNWVSVPDLVELPSGPTTLEVRDGVGSESLTPGRISIIVQGPGFLPVDLEGTIMPDQTTSFTVPMTTKAARRGNDSIEIKEQVFFDLNKATIRPESFDLLKEVAFVIRQYPQIRKLRIEGHTDSRGSDQYNFALSTDRAEAVLEFLVAHGVERDRLTSIGYGERRPLDLSENEDAWAINRRVDFFIEDWDVDFTPVGDGVPTPDLQQGPPGEPAP